MVTQANSFNGNRKPKVILTLTRHLKSKKVNCIQLPALKLGDCRAYVNCITELTEYNYTRYFEKLLVSQ